MPKKSVVGVGVLGTVLLWYYWRSRRQKEDRVQNVSERKTKVAVDRIFLQRLRQLIPIVIPGIRSKQFGILTLHTAFLVARTLVSIYVARLDGTIVKSIVEKDFKKFVQEMGKWLAIAVPATYINSMIRYLESKLAISLRTRLVEHVYAMYMESETYYRVVNLDGRLENPDQLLTADVNQWCAELAHIYSQLSKPLLDIVLMSGQLVLLAWNRGKGGSVQAGGLAGIVIAVTGMCLRLATPPFGKLVAEEARLYGELRASHSRVIASSEEIAFYGGHKLEHDVLKEAYRRHVTWQNQIYKKRIFYTMLEQFLMKYCWGAAGLVMIAIPNFIKKEGMKESAETVSDRTQDFITARGLLISAADAVERLLSSWKEITELAGRTARVDEMIRIFQEVKDGHYVKAKTEEVTTVGKTRKQSITGDLSKYVLGFGTVIDKQPYISLQNVPIVTPNGDVIVPPPGLTFDIKPGMDLLITGPNGCGKSSLFRMIGGLWAVRGGVLKKPAKGDMFYIPQRPYLTKGTLREQFIYPDTEDDFLKKGFTDDDLAPLLEVVDLGNVVKREGGLDKKNEWRDVLSGGEKQRVGMVRVFYHKPRFAILDECTSAVSIDVEGRMYQYAKSLHITLLTVTHRPTLWKYHNHILQFDGQGNWTFGELNVSARLSLKEEKMKIESDLAGLPRVQARLRELCSLLGEKSIYLPEAKGDEGDEEDPSTGFAGKNNSSFGGLDRPQKDNKPKETNNETEPVRESLSNPSPE